MALCLSVCPFVRICLSQVGVLSKRVDESSWFLAWRLLSTSPTLRYKEIQVSTFVPKSGLIKFRRSKSIVETRYQISSRKVDAQVVINWTVVGQLS